MPFHRFLPVLAHHKGFRVEEIVVNHRARKHGVSKYGFKRMFDGLIEGARELIATADKCVHLGLVGRESALAARLCAVHGDVRIREQLVRGSTP